MCNWKTGPPSLRTRPGRTHFQIRRRPSTSPDRVFGASDMPPVRTRRFVRSSTIDRVSAKVRPCTFTVRARVGQTWKRPIRTSYGQRICGVYICAGGKKHIGVSRETSAATWTTSTSVTKKKGRAIIRRNTERPRCSDRSGRRSLLAVRDRSTRDLARANT